MKNLVAGILVGLIIVFSSCAGEVVATRPADVEYARPGAPGADYVWIGGDWIWTGGTYRWHEGHWERPGPGRVWHEGHWESHGSGWKWRKGHW
jgi:WXXGXW repeat (2 copies)